MARGFVLVKICKKKSCKNQRWWRSRRINPGCVPMAIVAVNRYASETSVIYEKRGLGLDVIGLWGSGRNPMVVLLPSTWPFTENSSALRCPWESSPVTKRVDLRVVPDHARCDAAQAFICKLPVLPDGVGHGHHVDGRFKVCVS